MILMNTHRKLRSYTVKKLTNVKLDITYALKELPKWGEMRQIYNLLDKVEEYTDLKDKEVPFGENDEFEIVEGYRRQRFMCLVKGKEKIFLHINQDDAGKYLVQYVPERDVKYVVLLRIRRSQTNAAKAPTAKPTEKDVKMDQSTASNINVTAADLSLIPKTGKVAEFFKALKTHGNYISITGAVVPFQMIAVFEVYRANNQKAVGYTHPALPKPVPMEVRDGQIYEVISWPVKNFLEKARVENTFHFERYPLDEKEAADEPKEKEQPIEEAPKVNNDSILGLKGKMNSFNRLTNHDYAERPRREKPYQISDRIDGRSMLMTFDNEAVAETFKGVVDQQWLDMVLTHFSDDLRDGERIDVLFDPSRKMAPGEDIIIFSNGRYWMYEIKHNAIVKVDSATTLHYRELFNAFTLEFTTSGVGRARTPVAAAPVAIPTREWIPQINQFVRIEGEGEMYILEDFDQYTEMFILRLADSARRERTARLVGASINKDGFVTVEGGRLRPYTLRY